MLDTQQTLKNRKQQHRLTCYNENDKVHHDVYLFQFIHENGGFDNFDMILIKTDSCENASHTRRREREYIALNYGVMQDFISSTVVAGSDETRWRRQKSYGLEITVS